jgi:hypothetical protein
VPTTQFSNGTWYTAYVGSAKPTMKFTYKWDSAPNDKQGIYEVKKFWKYKTGTSYSFTYDNCNLSNALVHYNYDNFSIEVLATFRWHPKKFPKGMFFLDGKDYGNLEIAALRE